MPYSVMLRRVSFLVPVAALAALLASCRADAELSYYIGFEATEFHRETIAASFREWELATGVPAGETESSEGAVIVFRLGQLEGDAVGLSTFSTDEAFHAATLKQVDVLQRAEIVSEPRIWLRDWDGRLRHFNHEIGHVLTGGGHTPQCPSTMHTNSLDCGTETIDEDAAAKARSRINNGWLSRADTVNLSR
jgi:hypothetical protein